MAIRIEPNASEDTVPAAVHAALLAERDALRAELDAAKWDAERLREIIDEKSMLLRESDARYMALLKSVADMRGMQAPPPIIITKEQP